MDWEDYDSLEDFLEDYDLREFSGSEQVEIIDHFDIELEPDDTFEIEEDAELDVEDDIAEEWAPGERFDIEYWESIAEAYDGYENDYAEFEKKS